MCNEIVINIARIIEFTTKMKNFHVLFVIHFRNYSNAEYKVSYINKAFDSDENTNEIQSKFQNETSIEHSSQSGLFNQLLLTCAIVLLACVR